MEHVRIFAVLGFDEESYMTAYSVREAATYVAREYLIPVDVTCVHVNLADAEELRRLGVPTVVVGERVVSWGYAPLPHEVVDAVFREVTKRLEEMERVGGRGSVPWPSAAARPGR